VNLKKIIREEIDDFSEFQGDFSSRLVSIEDLDEFIGWSFVFMEEISKDNTRRFSKDRNGIRHWEILNVDNELIYYISKSHQHENDMDKDMFVERLGDGIYILVTPEGEIKY
jgi:hypothetical protein